MKNKLGIIVLFVIQAMAIPFSLFAGLMLLFAVGSFTETDWSQTGATVQSIIALTTMIIGVAYMATYIFSLIKTIVDKKISFVSWLPLLHSLIALIALVIWNYVNQLYK